MLDVAFTQRFTRLIQFALLGHVCWSDATAEPPWTLDTIIIAYSMKKKLMTFALPSVVISTCNNVFPGFHVIWWANMDAIGGFLSIWRSHGEVT